MRFHSIIELQKYNCNSRKLTKEANEILVVAADDGCGVLDLESKDFSSHSMILDFADSVSSSMLYYKNFNDLLTVQISKFTWLALNSLVNIPTKAVLNYYYD